MPHGNRARHSTIRGRLSSIAGGRCDSGKAPHRTVSHGTVSTLRHIAVSRVDLVHVRKRRLRHVSKRRFPRCVPEGGRVLERNPHLRCARVDAVPGECQVPLFYRDVSVLIVGDCRPPPVVLQLRVARDTKLRDCDSVGRKTGRSLGAADGTDLNKKVGHRAEERSAVEEAALDEFQEACCS